MARELGSGDLQHRVSFAKRMPVDDGYGNTKGEFQEQFSVAAAFRSRGGSEAVVAARLEGRNILGIYLRSSAQTRQIASDWRMTDVRTGDIYAVKIADSVTDRKWVYLEVSTGIAA
jgi:head-tail adaptor